MESAIISFLIGVIIWLAKKAFKKEKGEGESSGPSEFLEDVETAHLGTEVAEGLEEALQPPERRRAPRKRQIDYESWVTIFYRNGTSDKKRLGSSEYCIRDERVFHKQGNIHKELPDVVGFNYYQVETT